MKVSARNALPGVVKTVKRGAVNAEVIIEIAPGLTIVSVVTLEKASSVIVGIDS